MDERTYTRADIEAAFARLLAHTAIACDTYTNWTVDATKDDIIDILAGDWRADDPAQVEAAADAADLLPAIGEGWF